ncbi:MAG: hypothetical protein C0483_12560 [Pirellula sp.]|nr:hypothetical protein [Pirellula sp.]
MQTQFSVSHEHGVRLVGASNGDDEYLLWQQDDSDPKTVHFEFDDQVNSGHNNVKGCTVDSDGCHIVLIDGKMLHFNWHPPRHRDLDLFVRGLVSIYGPDRAVLEDLR